MYPKEMMKMRNYTPAQFAKLINVSVKTLQRWDNAGILPANRMPTNRRFYTDEHLKKVNGEPDEK